MTRVTSGKPKGRRQLTNALREAMRDLNIQLALLNRQLGSKVELKEADWVCLDLVNRYGPLSPSALAGRAGLHRATMTGVLDRLQRAGWITRERDADVAASTDGIDRRVIKVHANRERNTELFGLFAGMNHRMDRIYADYTEAELELIADFLHRTTEAGHGATEDLANSVPPN